jgi:uncharacterized membrane protein
VGLVTVVCGILLIALGVGGYVLPETKSVTAFIPAAFGVIFVVLGVLARQENLRKHVMHAAAALGVIGLIAALARLLPAVFKADVIVSEAHIALALMALICAVFVALCVRSFIQARRSRTRIDARGE